MTDKKTKTLEEVWREPTGKGPPKITMGGVELLVRVEGENNGHAFKVHQNPGEGWPRVSVFNLETMKWEQAKNGPVVERLRGVLMDMIAAGDKAVGTL